MPEQPTNTCPHCGSNLIGWSTPPDSSWGGAIHLVCFNDECQYYLDGWKHMMERYEVKASYRYKLDPDTGTAKPLPVWSPEAHRSFIVDEPEGGEDTP